MTQPRGQLACFRIYPEAGSGLFYRVRVFQSERTLRHYLKSGPVARTLGHYGRAMCSNWLRIRIDESGRQRLQPDMGEILLTVRNLGTEVITHECTHAALNWSQRVGFDPFDSKQKRGRLVSASVGEERFCYGLGQMARQIAVQGYKRGLIQDA